MIFNFVKKEYDIIKEYGTFEDLELPYKLYPQSNQIEVDDSEVYLFKSVISDIAIMYGMDKNQNNMTDFGYKVLDIYDKVYFQICQAKAPN